MPCCSRKAGVLVRPALNLLDTSRGVVWPLRNVPLRVNVLVLRYIFGVSTINRLAQSPRLEVASVLVTYA